ncbi:MAG: SDR family oxidoreductase [archaeon]
MILDEKIAVVTGGGGGIGRIICLDLARHGASVIILARSRNEIERTKELILKNEGAAISYVCDVSNEKDVKKTVLKIVKKYGKIDILINNAGVKFKKSLVETSLEDYERIMNTNLKGTFLLSKYILPYIPKNDKGVIINISSGAGKLGIKDLSVYCASKFAVIGLTEALALELISKVKVYTVCPGDVEPSPYHSLSKKINPHAISEKVVELASGKSRFPSGFSVGVYNRRDFWLYFRSKIALFFNR